MTFINDVLPDSEELYELVQDITILLPALGCDVCKGEHVLHLFSQAVE